LVRLHHQDRALHLLGDPGHRRGLTGPGRAEEYDVLLGPVETRGDLRDRRGLVTGGLVFRDHLERRDPALEVGDRSHAKPESVLGSMLPAYEPAPTTECLRARSRPEDCTRA